MGGDFQVVAGKVSSDLETRIHSMNAMPRSYTNTDLVFINMLLHFKD